MRLIEFYFTQLSAEQRSQLEQLQALYACWNEQINVISRKDVDNLYERHVLHSLAIAKVCNFVNDTKILDVGTGGGFPGIPLAILFPQVQFVLVDSIAKKIKVAREVCNALQLKNVELIVGRAENVSPSFDFIVSRAVTALPQFVVWVKNKVSPIQRNALPNGILYLKGGDLTNELKPFKKHVEEYLISDYFKEPFFETKKIIYLPI